MNARSGYPLPARTAEDLVSQLIWRALGPEERTRRKVRVVQQWAGLAGPALSLPRIAATHGVSTGTISNWVHLVAASAASVPLSDEQYSQLTRPSLPADDHEARVRRARAFQVPRPVPLSRLADPHWRRWGRIATRVISAVGPLTFGQLYAGIGQAGRRVDDALSSKDQLGVALLATGIAPKASDGRWNLVREADRVDRPADLRLVAAMNAGPEVVSWRAMQDVLARSGHTLNSYSVLYENPLLVQPAPGRWALISRVDDQVLQDRATPKLHRGRRQTQTQNR